MAISLQMHSGLDKKLPVLKKSSFKASCFQAKMVTFQSGKKANFYELLSLESTDVGFDEIKKAYRRKALEYHPDICHASIKEESTKQFLEIKEAYETLSDTNSRKVYDYELCLMEYSKERDYRMGDVAAGFYREVWDRQLQGLAMRSMQRVEKKRNH